LFKSGNKLSLSKILINLKNNKYLEIEKYIQKNYSIKNFTINLHTEALIDLVHKYQNNINETKHMYSRSESPQFIEDINDKCEQFKQIVLSVIDSKYVSCILLIGGYGRGEGGIYTKNGKLSPHNNLDFKIVTQGIFHQNSERYRKAILECSKEITNGIDISIDFSIGSKFKIQFGPNKLIYYDMKYGHRLVYGKDKWLFHIKRLNSKNIPVDDIRELILNRGVLLVLNNKILKKGNLSTSDKKVIVKHLVKAVIGYGDAILYLHHKYHWSYTVKKEQMLSISRIYPLYSKIYIKAIDFRFNPDYSRIIDKDLRLLTKFIIRSVEKIHLTFERTITNDPHLQWDNYYLKMMSSPFSSKKLNLSSSFITFKNLLTKSERIIWKPAGFYKRIISRLRGARGELMAMFPFIIYNKKLPIEHPLHQEELNNNFISNWVGHGDENYNQSAPAKILGESDK